MYENSTSHYVNILIKDTLLFLILSHLGSVKTIIIEVFYQWIVQIIVTRFIVSVFDSEYRYFCKTLLNLSHKSTSHMTQYNVRYNMRMIIAA